VSKPSSRASSSSARTGSSIAEPRTGSKKQTEPVVPDSPGSARIVAIANQKGGVGKSTTAVSLGAALAEIGFRVLVVDLDPQGNASTGMGIRHEQRIVNSYDVIVAETPVAEAIVHSPVPGLDAIPSTIDLAGAEIELVSQFSREGRLKRALAPVGEGSYDFIFLDCPPSLGLITVNALTAADELIVPIQCEYYALEGLGQLLRNVSLVQQNINPELRLTGIVMTMFDPRTKLSEQVVEEVRRFFGDIVYDAIIPRTVRLSEAPGYGVPITVYDSKSKGAESYRLLALEVALRPPPEAPMATYDHLPDVVMPAMVDESPPATPVADEALEDVPPLPAPEVEEAAPELSATTQAPPKPRPEAETQPPSTPPAQPTQTRQPKAEAKPAPKPAPEPVGNDDEIWESEPDAPRVRQIETPEPGRLPQRRVVVIDENADLRGPAGGSGPGPERRAAGESDATPSIGATLHDEDDGTKRRWRLFRKGGE
jgi:chromosome partitioning protein